MHGYYWDRMRLKKGLEEFVGGQFLMETKVGLVFRGQIQDWSIPDMSQRLVLIGFSWLCEPHFRVDILSRPASKWVLVEPPFLFKLRVEYTSYYFQRNRNDREKRIKMWTPLGEVCRFFQIGDLTNLKEQDGEFLPLYHHPAKFDSGPED